MPDRLEEAEMRAILEGIARNPKAAPSNRVQALRELRQMDKQRPDDEGEDFEANLGHIKTK